MIKKTYRIALRKRNHDHFWESTDYHFTEYCPGGDRYWLADPFLFDWQGKTYLFYEMLDRAKDKGCIAYSIIENEKITPPQKIIEERYHLSFPYVFSEDGNIYLMPETCEERKILLYKAIRFPDKWEKETLVEDVFCCDTIWLPGQGKKEALLTSILIEPPKEGTLQSCYVRNEMFPVKEGLCLKTADRTITEEGDQGIRNAGACFDYKGEIIRPGQDCTENRYGNGVVFFQIDSITPYRETKKYELTKEELDQHLIRKGKEPLVGTHTYNCSNDYEVVDFAFEEEISNIYQYLASAFGVIRLGRAAINKLLRMVGLRK